MKLGTSFIVLVDFGSNSLIKLNKSSL